MSALLAGCLAIGCAGSDAQSTEGAVPGGGGQYFDHVVFVSIDTLRADHLGLYGYPRPTSPFLDSLGERGLVFERAISAASHTAPSHATMFTSLYPSQHGVVSNGMLLDERIPTMASLFRTAGFDTTAVIAARFLDRIASGFDEVFLKRPEPVGSWPADRVVDRAIAWHVLREDAGRFFLWLHFFDVHETRGNRAFAVPTALATQLAQQYEQEPEAVRSVWHRRGLTDSLIDENLDSLHGYDAQIQYVDQNLKRFFDYMGRHEPGRVLWVITADHGEGLGNHGTWGHGIHIYQEQVRVPLLLVGDPAWQRRKRIDQLVSHVDLLPTLTALTGLEVPSGVEGQSLLPLLAGDEDAWRPRLAFSERRPANAVRQDAGWPPGPIISLQSQRFKYIHNGPEGRPEFFDLEGDPYELANLIDQDIDHRQQLATQLAEWYSRLISQRPWEEFTDVLDPATAEELEALGYIAP